MTSSRPNPNSIMAAIKALKPKKRKGAENAELRRAEIAGVFQLCSFDLFSKLCAGLRPLRLCVKSLPVRVGFGLLLLSGPVAGAATPEDFFHGGAMNYFSNNIPQALTVVTNGRAQFPADENLKKLEELLKQQQDQQQQEQDKQEQNKKDEPKQDQKDQQPKQQPQKPDQSKPDKPKPEQPKQQEAKAQPAGQMTPQQAARLLDAQKGEESALVFRPPEKPKDNSKPVKDW